MNKKTNTTLQAGWHIYTKVIPWAVMCIGLIATWQSVLILDRQKENLYQQKFANTSNELVVLIRQRWEQYEQALEGGQGLFAASDNVNRNEWKTYYNELGLQSRLKGIQAFAFAKAIDKREDIPALEEQVRSDGYPNFHVYPDTPREDYSTILYIEPFDERNQAAFGYDMFSEHNRRVALQRARDTGEASLSGIVTLVQEITEEKQAGTLLYLPVYKNGMSINTTEQRREALDGFVYGAFRMGDFFVGMKDLYDSDLIHFSVYDGTEMIPSALLYTNFADTHDFLNTHTQYSAKRTIEFGGRTWTIEIHSSQKFSEQLNKDTSQALPIALGVTISTLLFLLFLSYNNAKEKALGLARSMTDELRENKNLLEIAVESSDAGLWNWDMITDTVVYSPAWKTLLGYEEEDIGNSIEEWNKKIHPDDIEQVRSERKKHMRGETPHYTCEYRMKTKDGTYNWVLDRGKVMEISSDGIPMRMVGTLTNIQERKQEENLYKERNKELEKFNSFVVEREIELKALKDELKETKQALEDLKKKRTNFSDNAS